MELIQDNLIYILLGFGIAVLVLFILCIILFAKVVGQKKRMDFFMGSNRRPSQNLEMKLKKYYDTSKAIDEKYTKLLEMVTDMDMTMKNNIQKVGLVRYNPFEEMGGNLCFALALLDGEDNGVVVNGIHSRTGSFTYAKPIQMGVSIYMLSDEEMKAVQMAKEQAYQPKHEKVVKVKFKPTFRRRDSIEEERIQKLKEQEEKLKLQKAAEGKEGKETKEAVQDLGDVTTEEKQRILEDERIANQIAAMEVEVEQKIVEELKQIKQELPKREAEQENMQQEKVLQKNVVQPKVFSEPKQIKQPEETIVQEAPVFIKKPEEDEE